MALGFPKKKQFCEMTSSESPITAATLWFLRQVHFGPKTLQSHGIKGGKIQAVKAVGGGILTKFGQKWKDLGVDRKKVREV